MDYSDGVLQIGGVSSAGLVARFGSPLYVYDASIIRRQIARIGAAFARLPLSPFYAVKANSNLSILRLIRDGGFGCDVVSPGEAFLTAAAGFDPTQVWFTCSNASDEDLRAIGNREIVINVNSLFDLDRCIRLRLPNPLALRVNPEVGAGHHRDVVTGGFGVKFGIELPELETARQNAEAANLEVVGLHAHIGSGIDSAEPLLESARRLVGLAETFPDLRYLNFGGGIAVPYRPGETDFALQDYADGLHQIAEPMLVRRGMKAILEPGRFLVAESGTLLSMVTSKKVTGGVEWIGCDTGFNHLARPSKYGSYHHIVNASNGSSAELRWNAPADVQGVNDGIVIAGNLCESGDVFTRDIDGVRPRKMNSPRVGDLIAFCDAGAYGFSMASEYNARLLPAEVMVDGEEVRLIRERQRFDDLTRGQ